MLPSTVVAASEVQQLYSGMRTDTLRSREELSSFGDDFHLLVGMTKDSIEAAARGIGFPQNYSREGAFRRRSKRDFITERWGDQMTGYDFAESIKMWIETSGNEAWSLAEVWHARGGRGVGEAVLFISHIQGQSLESTLENVPDNIPVWLDYVILRQCQNDFDPVQIHSVIGYISNEHRGTFAIMDEPSLSYLNRSFCIFEVACTREDKLYIHLSESTRGMFLSGSLSIDSKAAEATNKEHKKLVDLYIHAKHGGFDKFNKSVSKALRNGITKNRWQCLFWGGLQAIAGQSESLGIFRSSGHASSDIARGETPRSTVISSLSRWVHFRDGPHRNRREQQECLNDGAVSSQRRCAWRVLFALVCIIVLGFSVAAIVALGT